MKKIILGILSLTLTTSIFASGDGQIINERTTILGNAKNVEFHRLEGKSVPKYVNARARTYNESGTINRNVRIRSDHYYSITNYTSSKRRYHFKYEVTAEGGDGTLHEGDVDVNAQGTWFDSAQLAFVTSKNFSKVYTITASTQVSGETSARDIDRATLTIR